MIKIKQQLFEACQNYVLERENTMNKIISSNQKALSSETKSSAGDKHETGRAMLQLEMEKTGQQLAVINQMKTILDRILLDDNSKIAKLGSLVITNKNNYFLAISVGELQVENKRYYAVSIASPIGKLLLGKKVGDEFEFNDKIVVNEIY
ncbi:GreA/GreB family elongation factor [Aureibaculum sp. 2210JD6-5]|uniref:GreA/GreB family elongation factor n=1 Tax=Aureibaculum sp. 2210JD6-5 TaxID=3103957 RepID=UPI002AAD17B7|nr:GreA/GreB family elongation factor [Aureibaculum sp. 2210JD6-5]MDY7395779.1 GreA/GreB family elongation factor [Aureibaculum sp. 2210JD6-5]